ncbi:MAG: aminopeptidase [Gammaproteobacteria bacterium]|nr:aminopeptidase [Gammaproteobacteria bacterium]
MSYYAQSIGGQLRLLSSREPVAALLKDPGTDAKLKNRLARTQAMRSFASEVLALPDNDSYRGYVQLESPYVVWSLFATPEFSLRPRQWCFPIAGCVPYRGYFAARDARKFARALRAEGMDVYVGGVAAYSTLGWFDDPLLSSMLYRGETETAAIIFHELAHAKVYAAGDAVFNESFAMTVEHAGMHRWLAAHGTSAQRRAYRTTWRHKQVFYDLIETARARLSALYASDAKPAFKRRGKRRMIAQLRAQYVRLQQRRTGRDGYDHWFNAPINNAKLAAVAIYRELVPDFERLMAACDGDLARFYAAVAALGELEPNRRHAHLNSAHGCS